MNFKQSMRKLLSAYNGPDRSRYESLWAYAEKQGVLNDFLETMLQKSAEEQDLTPQELEEKWSDFLQSGDEQALADFYAENEGGFFSKEMMEIHDELLGDGLIDQEVTEMETKEAQRSEENLLLGEALEEDQSQGMSYGPQLDFPSMDARFKKNVEAVRRSSFDRLCDRKAARDKKERQKKLAFAEEMDLIRVTGPVDRTGERRPRDE